MATDFSYQCWGRKIFYDILIKYFLQNRGWG
ncbi:hypothetical protein MVUOKPPV_CDS0267 [Klebsiella phage phi1_175008]|uniref:Uncharacterized protein n=1 Tax=Klebsiella phage phi1_175008 TaxID=3127744 RepID=A0ACD5FRF4_9CAUD